MRKLIVVTGVLGIVAVCLIVVQQAKPQSGGPKITWTISQYENTLFPGTVKSTDLSFTADHDVPSASIFITPSIAGLLSVVSTGGGTFPAGKSGNLHVLVSAP